MRTAESASTFRDDAMATDFQYDTRDYPLWKDRTVKGALGDEETVKLSANRGSGRSVEQLMKPRGG
jgi:hypothetical protein